MLRSHRNHELNASHLGREVALCGWVSVTRDHGGVNFVDLRDRWGVTQVVFRPERNRALHEASKALRTEFCVRIKGKVCRRPEGTENLNLSTGQIEIEADELTVLSRSKTPPFEIGTKEKITEELRLKHRSVDLRQPGMQESLLFRSRMIQEMRRHLHGEEFAEVETPILTKSTPEGARDYLVPSRLNSGQFFALPQSPQLFKQILMVSGYDRYFQIARCFRDEDLRADRQPEFTQLDLEMSFVEEDDVFGTIERTLAAVYENVLKKPLKTPFPRYGYAEVMERYGTDKPDLRFGLEIRDVSGVFKSTSLRIFKEVIGGGGAILALQVPEKAADFSRKEFDDLIAFAKSCGASGLAYLKVTEQGIESPIAKFFTEAETAELKRSLPQEARSGDVVFFAADKKKTAQQVLGAVRLELGKKLGLVNRDELVWAWVNRFPLFQYNAQEKRWDSEHHPFTGIVAEDVGKLGSDNGSIRSLSYDLVLNGNEIASGSIRIHDAGVQEKVFEAIGLDAEESRARFGFLLEAFGYGPPPHGGIALGLDRLTAIFLARESIRDVIAFPKTQKAICLMTQAPSTVSAAQLKELGIRIA